MLSQIWLLYLKIKTRFVSPITCDHLITTGFTFLSLIWFYLVGLFIWFVIAELGEIQEYFTYRPIRPALWWEETFDFSFLSEMVYSVLTLSMKYPYLRNLFNGSLLLSRKRHGTFQHALTLDKQCLTWRVNRKILFNPNPLVKYSEITCQTECKSQ